MKDLNWSNQIMFLFSKNSYFSHGCLLLKKLTALEIMHLFPFQQFWIIFSIANRDCKGFFFLGITEQDQIRNICFWIDFKLYSFISLYKWSIKIIPHEILFFLKTHFKFQVDVGLRTSMKGLNWLDQMLFFSKKYILFTLLSFSKNWQHFHSISNYNHPCL